MQTDDDPAIFGYVVLTALVAEAATEIVAVEQALQSMLAAPAVAISSALLVGIAQLGPLLIPTTLTLVALVLLALAGGGEPEW